jgi:Phosphopantetheine attachment site
MPEASSWDVISDGGNSEVILAVDFPAAGRVEATFADLAEHIGSRWSHYDILQTVPPTGPGDRNASGQDYIQRWTREIRAAGRPVAAVLGYCAGAVYTAAIADEIGRWQQPAPPVIVFDPQVGDGPLSEEMYREMYRVLGSLLSADKVSDAKKKAADLVVAGDGDLFDLAAALTGFFRETATPAFDRLGLSEAGRTQIVGLFQDYLSWLSATTYFDPSRTWKSAWAVLSTEHVANAGGNPATTTEFGRIITIDTTHAGVLRSESTARKVVEQIIPGSSTEESLPESPANIDLNDSATRLETVRSIWCDVLDVSDVEDDVAFFDAGGNSLLVVALVEKLSDASGHMLKTRDVLRAPSIKEQAELLAQPASGPAQNAR